MQPNPALGELARAVGIWDVTGSHPYLPNRALTGRVTFDLIEGGAFLRMQSTMDAEEIPDGVAIFGVDDTELTCTMLYFDVRGVSRVYHVALEADGFTWSRDTPQFAQRFHVTLAPDGSTMEGEGTMKKNGSDWEPDLRLSYVRAAN